MRVDFSAVLFLPVRKPERGTSPINSFRLFQLDIMIGETELQLATHLGK